VALIGTFWLFEPMVARIAVYQVMTTITRPALGTAMDYFYTADATCLPDGPHFSFMYYMMYVGIVGTCGKTMTRTNSLSLSDFAPQRPLPRWAFIRPC
jgi:hypothetical protein